MQKFSIFVAVINLKTMISMRKLRLFAVAAMAAISVSAMAQVTYGNDYSYQPTNSKIYGSDNEAFSLFYIQYSPSQLHSKATNHGESATDNESVNVLSLGYSYYIPLGDMPLFLTPGAAVQWFFKSTEEKEVYGNNTYTYKTKFNMISAKIPINVMYSFEVSEAFRIEPYAGIYGRINIWGQSKDDDHSFNIFDKDEVGEAQQAKRFQLGWNAGVNFRITDAFTVGAGYYMDFMKFQDYEYKEHKFSTNFQGFDITLGLNF
jgi:opacity protein-like surface antigen